VGTYEAEVGWGEGEEFAGAESLGRAMVGGGGFE